MTARTKPIYIFVVERNGQSLTMHAIPVVRESNLSYYVADHSRHLFGWRIQVPKVKAHRSMKAAWSAMRDELVGSQLYLRASLANIDSLIAQIPKRVPRHPRKAA